MDLVDEDGWVSSGVESIGSLWVYDGELTPRMMARAWPLGLRLLEVQ